MVCLLCIVLNNVIVINMYFSFPWPAIANTVMTPSWFKFVHIPQWDFFCDYKCNSSGSCGRMLPYFKWKYDDVSKLTRKVDKSDINDSLSQQHSGHLTKLCSDISMFFHDQAVYFTHTYWWIQLKSHGQKHLTGYLWMHSNQMQSLTCALTSLYRVRWRSNLALK